MASENGKKTVIFKILLKLKVTHCLNGRFYVLWYLSIHVCIRESIICIYVNLYNNWELPYTVKIKTNACRLICMNVINLLSSQLKCQKLNCEVGICLLSYSLNNIFPGLASSSRITNREKKKRKRRGQNGMRPFY